MQREYRIELRVNFADDGKKPVMNQAIAEAARHVFAKACMLADGVKPDIAVFSDDYFHGQEVINLLDDTLAQGEQLLTELGVSEEEPLDQELIDAVKQSR